jgi:hypothetical protein
VLPAKDELSLGEYVFATGPTWRQGPVSLYGGLLVRCADGEFEASAKTARAGLQANVDARWDAGGYVGGQVTLFRTDPSRTYGISRCDLSLEGRFSGDSTSFSAGVLLPFGGEY